MRFSDIKVGNVYNVIFDPVNACEFNGKHLALVLKKNNDKTTFIVMPLTSAPSGVGVNKMDVGQIATLPESLKCNHTYAVFNQVRTVNANRFIALKEGGNVIQCPVEVSLFDKLLILAIQELVFSLSRDKKINILKKAYENECVIKAKDLAYTILDLKKSAECEHQKISELKSQINQILQGVPYSLDKKYIEDGIQDIFQESLGV